MTIETHEGSTLFSDARTEPTLILSSVYVVMTLERNIRYGGSGSLGDQVACLAWLFANVPGLFDAVVGMKTMLEKRKAAEGG